MARIKPDMVYPDMPPMRLVFTHSLKKVRKLYRQLGIEFDASHYAPNKNGATTTTFENAAEPTIYLVWMSPDTSRSFEVDVAILSHEATHVMASYLNDIGIDDPDDEIMSYVVQSVTQHLCQEHFEWKQKQLDKR